MVGTLDEAREKEKATGGAAKSKPSPETEKTPAEGAKAKPQSVKPSGAAR